MNRHLVHTTLALASVLCLTGADWRQFRGNDTTSVSSDKNVPTTISGTSIAWKLKLPGGGLSGPITVGNQVFLTASSGPDQDRLHVISVDAKTGKQVWERQFWATGRTMCHNTMRNATPTPASDGQRVVAFYSSNDLVCLDLAGNMLWYRGLTHDFPNASNSLGMASSPVIVNDTVIVQVESDAESFAMGIDVKTGITRWKSARPRRSNWTSPAIIQSKSGKQVLLQSSAGLAAVDPKTGKVAWEFGNGASTIPSSAVAGDTIYIASNGLTAIRPNETGKPEVLWNDNRLAPSSPSPVVSAGRTYTLSRGGILIAGDAKTGEVIWRLRLEGKGRYWSTPVIARGHLYAFHDSGLSHVIKLGDKKGEVLAEFDFGETILCSPAIANGALYVRGHKHLWKIADE